jgi:hypothetical protein
MKKHFLFCFFLLLFFHSLPAQNRYGLVLENKVLQAGDTISLSYPFGNAIIACELFDGDNNMLGNEGVTWSLSGNLTILDTPLVSSRIIIETSGALQDQRGYLSATALESGVQWISNKVFIKIKGKNSRVLSGNFFREINNYYFIPYDVAGRLLGGSQETQKHLISPRHCTVIILRDAANDTRKKTIIIK